MLVFFISKLVPEQAKELGYIMSYSSKYKYCLRDLQAKPGEKHLFFGNDKRELKEYAKEILKKRESQVDCFDS